MNLKVMATKRYFTLPRTPEQELHHRMQLSVRPRSLMMILISVKSQIYIKESSSEILPLFNNTCYICISISCIKCSDNYGTDEVSAKLTTV